MCAQLLFIHCSNCSSVVKTLTSKDSNIWIATTVVSDDNSCTRGKSERIATKEQTAERCCFFDARRFFKNRAPSWKASGWRPHHRRSREAGVEEPYGGIVRLTCAEFEWRECSTTTFGGEEGLEGWERYLFPPELCSLCTLQISVTKAPWTCRQLLA